MQQLDDLASRLWTWRARQQPRTRDDIPRLPRPTGWLPELGAAARERHRQEHAEFAAELAAIRPVDIGDHIDHRLLVSLLARVEFELDVVKVWQQPRFWTDQALGPVFDTLLRPGVDDARIAEVCRFLQAIPGTLAEALSCLPTVAEREFAELAVAELVDIDRIMSDFAISLAAVAASPDLAAKVRDDAASATTALLGFRDELDKLAPGLPAWRPIGRPAYEKFLRDVACLPFGADRISVVGELEYDRAVTLERLEQNRHRLLPPPVLAIDSASQQTQHAADELAVRAFYDGEGLLSQPADLPHYLTLPMPGYLEALRFLGVVDDLTDFDRQDEDSVHYFPAPRPGLTYFYAAEAADPRAGIVHEGVHYQQLALARRNARPARRHFYDSGPNEGIAFYNEEMMLTAGLFEDAPHSRITMYNFMRLRALRVELDVGLATGAMTIERAAERLQFEVPMDETTARQEAAFFAETPGQALSYQIGKTQIFALITDAIRDQGDGFDLRSLHDYLWLNGNVPIALLRWEFLGRADELEAIGVEA